MMKRYIAQQCSQAVHYFMENNGAKSPEYLLMTKKAYKMLKSEAREMVAHRGRDLKGLNTFMGCKIIRTKDVFDNEIIAL